MCERESCVSLPPGAIGWSVIVAFPGHTRLVLIYVLWLCAASTVRPNKKISVFRVTGLTFLGRVGT